jgi:hypothetical protein
MKKAPVNGREFTADDVTYSLAYFEGLARNTMYRSKLDAKAIALQLRSMAALAQGAKRRSGARLIEQLVRLPEV